MRWNIFKVNNKTPERRYWRRSGVFIVNFEQVNVSCKCSWVNVCGQFQLPSNLIRILHLIRIGILPNSSKCLRRLLRWKDYIYLGIIDYCQIYQTFVNKIHKICKIFINSAGLSSIFWNSGAEVFFLQYRDLERFFKSLALFPASIDLFRIIDRNTRIVFKICVKLTRKTMERR